MKLSGDVNTFSVKYFISQWKLTQDLNTFETFFYFYFYLSSLWYSFILAGIRWNCQFASLRKIFSHRSNPSSFFFSSSWKSTKGERLSRHKLNQATHCIKNFYANSKKPRELFLMKYFTLSKTGAFFPCLTRSEIDSIGYMENINTFPYFFFTFLQHQIIIFKVFFPHEGLVLYHPSSTYWKQCLWLMQLQDLSQELQHTVEVHFLLEKSVSLIKEITSRIVVLLQS